MPLVKEERTGWRDEKLSRRHRRWGWDCPAVDLDFLLLEYDKGKASALVEYKNEHAETQYASHPTYQALIDLGNRAGIPVIACRYSDDFSKFQVTPLNDNARNVISSKEELSEKNYVKLLYKMRGREVPESVLDGMDVEI